ncbi:bilobe protein, conserved [Trypanosoma equiperdum]|uniref:Bilobe protein, conserved n=2 Tax=Trypanozoon TaxID=39700 RepID=Q57W72_TRYB2|nr:hypothetical protein, conserved [Trypanosoma brucei brucei TREU927]AAX70147.1 hypothetical protein, conserved [Trypanosoma brucei]AAZ13066.1 hypothetical protein, conserved [Trypanosoma brucei brucei TREU927]SCU66104.1 bilobe protein, conserved [Trypanosoma equiperdum]
MKYSGDTPVADDEAVDKLRGELVDLQKRFILLFKASGQSLEQIRSTVESSLKSRANEPTQGGRLSDRDSMLQDLVRIVERTQRYVQLAGKPPLGSVSADALQIEYQSWASNMPTASSHRSHGDHATTEQRVKSLQLERDDVKRKLQEAEENNAKLQRKLKAAVQKYNHLAKNTKEMGEPSHTTRARTLSPSAHNGNSSKSSEAVSKRFTGHSYRDSAGQRSCRQNSCNDVVGDSAFNSQHTSARGGSSEFLDAVRQDNASLRREVTKLKEELRQTQRGAIARTKQGDEDVGSLLMKITGLKQELVLEERQRMDALLHLGEAKRENQRLVTQVEELKQQLVHVQQSDGRVPDVISVESKETNIMNSLGKELGHTQQVAAMQVLQAKELTRVLERMQDFLHSSFLKQRKLVTELEKAGKGWSTTPLQLEAAQTHEGCTPANKVKIEDANVSSPGVESSGGKSRTILKASDDSGSSDLNTFCDRVLTVDDVDPLTLGKNDGDTHLRSQNSELVKENQQLHDALSKLSMMYRSTKEKPKSGERSVMEREALPPGVKQPDRSAEVASAKRVVKEHVRKDNAKAHRDAKKEKAQSSLREQVPPKQLPVQPHQLPKAPKPQAQRDLPPKSPVRRHDSHLQRSRTTTPRREAHAQYDQKQRHNLSSSLQAETGYTQSPSASQSRDDRSSSHSSTSTARFLRRLAEFRFPKEGAASVPDSGERNTDSGKDDVRNFSPPRLSYMKST